MKFNQAKRIAFCSGTSPKYKVGNSETYVEKRYPIFEPMYFPESFRGAYIIYSEYVGKDKCVKVFIDI